jgi:hypothetical protein
VIQQNPVIVRIVEAPHDPTGLADVLVGVLGLSGVMTLAAILLGLTVGGLLYWVRSRSSANLKS